MSHANVEVEGNANSSKCNGNANFGFEAFPATPGLFRGFAQQVGDRTKESCQKLKVASGEIAEVLRKSYSTNAKDATDCGAKVIEISTANTNSVLQFMADLMDTRSVAEAFNLSAAQSRRNWEVASAQNRELLELAQKVAIQSAEPIQTSFAKVLQSAV